MRVTDWDRVLQHTEPLTLKPIGTISVTSLNELIWEMENVSLQHVASFFLLFFFNFVVFRRQLFAKWKKAMSVKEPGTCVVKCECGDGSLPTWCSSSLPVGEVLSPFWGDNFLGYLHFSFPGLQHHVFLVASIKTFRTNVNNTEPCQWT